MSPDLKRADEAFAEGRFDEAEKIYALVLQDDQKNAHANLRLGRIQLYSNRLSEARQTLSRAKTKEAAPYLGEAYYREDDFEQAAKHFRRPGEADQAKKLASFSGQTPYETTGPEIAEISWIETDPLPLVEARINGSDPVVLFIDTGGSEIILDSDFSKELRLPSFGSFKATGFAGGKPGGLTHSRIEEFVLGPLTIRNLPILTLPLRKLAPLWEDRHRIDGVLGTTLLYHFLPTLDYPSAKLILRRNVEPTLSGSQITIPFWMAGDHFMLAWGAVNELPQLLFVDTGVGGVAWKGPMSTIEAANVKMFPDQATESSMGGGEGTFTIVPLQLDELSLGGAVERNVSGNFSGFPVEHIFDFRIGGMISHEFFKHYVFTMDFKNMQLYLDRAG